MDYEFIFSDETLKAIFDFGVFSGMTFVITFALLLGLYLLFMEYLDIRRTRKRTEKFFSALEARLSLIEEELTKK